MFTYSDVTRTTARNYNLQERDVIFCQLIAAGVDRVDAFHVVYNRGKNNAHATRQTDEAAAADFLANNPGAKILIKKIKTQQTINHNGTLQEVREATRQEEEETEEERKKREELETPQGLARRMTKELQNQHGKEAVQGLMTLAKLKGFDKVDTRAEEERRKYFLPYRSKCRGCALMKTYIELHEE